MKRHSTHAPDFKSTGSGEKQESRKLKPAYVQAMALDRGLTECALRVGIVLVHVHYNHETGRLDPSIERLHDELGYSQRSIIDATKLLEERGWFQVTRRPNKTNSYTPMWLPGDRVAAREAFANGEKQRDERDAVPVADNDNRTPSVVTVATDHLSARGMADADVEVRDGFIVLTKDSLRTLRHMFGGDFDVRKVVENRDGTWTVSNWKKKIMSAGREFKAGKAA